MARWFGWRLLAFVAGMILQLAPALAEIPIEKLAADRQIGSPQISPDGVHIAILKLSEVAPSLVIASLSDRKAKPVVVNLAGSRPRWVVWKDNDRLIAGVGIEHDVRGVNGSWRGRAIWMTRVVAVRRDGSNLKVMMSDERTLLWRRVSGFRRAWNNSSAGILANLMPEDPQHILMSVRNRGGSLHVRRVNVDDGSAETIFEGSEDTVRWIIDKAANPIARWDYNFRTHSWIVFARPDAQHDWKEITRYGERDFPDIDLITTTDRPQIMIAASRLNNDKARLVEFDIESRKEVKTIFQQKDVDVGEPYGDLIFDPQTVLPIGLTYIDDITRTVFFDPTLKEVQASVDATFPNESSVLPVSWSQDRQKISVFAEGPKEPGSYYFYDRAKGTIERVGQVFPGINTSELGETGSLTYRASDGTTIRSYVTLPPGRPQKNLPLVVHPHGGPERRDYIQYDPWVQAMASRGYAVFQPNFRGSGGYGRAFEDAGHREWGRKMQDDITEGVKKLISMGVADPNRICIVGASYGGYAALAGGAFTPELYKCVISVAGVGDLEEFLDDRRRRWGYDSKIYEYWVDLLGDPDKDAARMKAASPTHSAASFKAPVLLIHGENDNNVLLRQSEIMRDALQDAGKPVELIELEKEGHSVREVESRKKLFSETLRFLNQHIPAGGV